MDLDQIQWLKPLPPDPGGQRHLNCFQQTIRAHCDLLGMDEERAIRLGNYLGGGMRCGGTCGPVNAALLLLSQLYGDDPDRVDEGKRFLLEFARDNGGSWLCADLRDEEHVRCDAAIRYAIDYVARQRDRRCRSESGVGDGRA